MTEITPHLLLDFHPWWPPGGPLGGCNPVWQHCWNVHNPSLYWNPSDEVANPPGTYLGDSIGFRWLDLTWQAPGGLTPHALLHSFGGQFTPIRFRQPNPATYWFILQFDEWCRGHSTLSGDPKHDTLLPTFSGDDLVALRYSLEEAGKAVEMDLSDFEMIPQARFSNAINQSNLQSFLVCVETKP